jgi:hypothetical protein
MDALLPHSGTFQSFLRPSQPSYSQVNSAILNWGWQENGGSRALLPPWASSHSQPQEGDKGPLQPDSSRSSEVPQFLYPSLSQALLPLVYTILPGRLQKNISA